MEVQKGECSQFWWIYGFRIFFLVFVLLQVTPKTLADVKGGTLISYEGKVQVHTSHLAFTTHFFPASSSAVQQKWIKFQKDLCINYAKLHLLNLQMTWLCWPWKCFHLSNLTFLSCFFFFTLNFSFEVTYSFCSCHVCSFLWECNHDELSFHIKTDSITCNAAIHFIPSKALTALKSLLLPP